MGPTWITAHGEPAGGAPIEDLIPATIVGLLLIVGLAAFGWAHRTGRTKLLTAGGSLGERISGLPPWAAVGAAVTGVSLIVAVFGFYWDVATHIDNGRDAGPFANPAHYWIIIGLAGIGLAGALSILVGAAPSNTTVRISDDWHAPLGGILLFICGGIAVLGFPLDDVWHRIFGQDVTLWSPTHLQMVGGAALSTLALWILVVEGRREAGDAHGSSKSRMLEIVAASSVLVGFSALHAEFDYSVPQFRLLYHPILLMLSAAAALVAIRVRLGRGAALFSVAFFIGLRGGVSLIVGPILDHTILHFPLYIAEALAVELAALWWGTDRRISFGAIAGLAIVAIGLPAEWVWSHVWMTIGWPPSLLPETLPLSLIAAVSGGLLGAMIGGALEGPERSVAVGWKTGLATAVGVAFVLAYPFPVNADLKGTATLSLDRLSSDENRAFVEIALDPPTLAEEAEWFNVTAWQGGGSIVTEPQEKAPGLYRTEEPIPLDGEWKSLIRLQQGNSIVALPIFLPEDPAIPAEEVPAEDNVTREFVLDKKIILREAKDVSGALTAGGSLAIAAIALAWIASLTWGFRRMGSEPKVPRRVALASTAT